MLDYVQRWVKEPPPEFLFEVSEKGLAWAQTRDAANFHTQPAMEKALTASSSQPNILRADIYRLLLPASNKGKATRNVGAALAIPDHATRMSVLDFEEFPSDEEQRIGLVRFRLRKSVPFPIDDAQVAYSIQWHEDKQIEVLAAAIARPIIEEYEQLLRDAGYQVGLVIPSTLAALPLCGSEATGLTLLAKASGDTLSIVLLDHNRVRVIRSINFAEEYEDSLSAETGVTRALQQTIAYSEDQIGQSVARLLLCGFGRETETLGSGIEQEFGIPWTPLRSRFGAATQENAGLLGLMERYTA